DGMWPTKNDEGVTSAGGLRGAIAAERGLLRFTAAAGRKWIAGVSLGFPASRTLGQAMWPADQATPASATASASLLPTLAASAVCASAAGLTAPAIIGPAYFRGGAIASSSGTLTSPGSLAVATTVIGSSTACG